MHVHHLNVINFNMKTRILITSSLIITLIINLTLPYYSAEAQETSEQSEPEKECEEKKPTFIEINDEVFFETILPPSYPIALIDILLPSGFIIIQVLFRCIDINSSFERIFISSIC